MLRFTLAIEYLFQYEVLLLWKPVTRRCSKYLMHYRNAEPTTIIANNIITFFESIVSHFPFCTILNIQKGRF